MLLSFQVEEIDNKELQKLKATLTDGVCIPKIHIVFHQSYYLVQSNIKMSKLLWDAWYSEEENMYGATFIYFTTYRPFDML